MTDEQELKPFAAKAQDYGFMDARAPDLLYQTATHITAMIRDGDQYRRKAVQTRDLSSAIHHIEGLQGALNRLDLATVVSAFAGLGAREPVLVTTLPDDIEDPDYTQVPLRWMA